MSLLFLGVECIRAPGIRLNGEDLCSTANSRQVEMGVDACVSQGTGAVGIHGIGAGIRHARAERTAIEDGGVRDRGVSRPSNDNIPTAALPKVFFPVTEWPGAFAPL